MRRRPGLAVLTLAVACTVVVACAEENSDTGVITIGVAAAPSLSAAFTEIIGDFEEKEVLGNIVRNTLEDSDQKGIQVYIGDEVPSAGKGMEDCSVVTTTYDLGDGMKGTIGIVGPKRMDYDKVVDALKNVMHQLEDYYKK